jgi:hypothetical protein
MSKVGWRELPDFIEDMCGGVSMLFACWRLPADQEPFHSAIRQQSAFEAEFALIVQIDSAKDCESKLTDLKLGTHPNGNS